MGAYEQLLQQADRDINSLDFDALRQAYAQQPGYAPYATSPETARLREAIEEANWSVVAAIGSALLAGDALQPELHHLVGHAFGLTGDLQRAEWHRVFAAGLMTSILRSGDGQTYDTAIRVVHIREEYEAIRFLRLQPHGQALHEHDGRFFDVVEVADKDDNPVGELYFDVTMLLQAADKTG